MKLAIETIAGSSTHPVASAIYAQLSAENSTHLPASKNLPMGEYLETPGQGAAARIKFNSAALPVLMGTPESIRRATLDFPSEIEQIISSAHLNGNSISIVAIDGIAVAAFEVGDTLRSDSAKAISQFKEAGIDAWLITGDSEAAATQIANKVGIKSDRLIARATPEAKIEKIKELQSQGRKILMIGDGINDAAALATADLSMAMGTGTDTAQAAADITLMRPSLLAAIDSIDISKKTLRTIKTNLGWAFIYNVFGIPIAALGALSPMYAGGAMAFSSLFVVLNSLRLRKATTLPA
ncbi:MAG: HAD family hydrolase [Actinobacteria bacterium]|nr:HAD family hydrolase [Actinomycetota bacterium]